MIVVVVILTLYAARRPLASPSPNVSAQLRQSRGLRSSIIPDCPGMLLFLSIEDPEMMSRSEESITNHAPEMILEDESLYEDV